MPPDWLAWIATTLGCTVGVAVAAAAIYYFRTTQSLAVLPVTWGLGAFVGMGVTVVVLYKMADWRYPDALLTIIETTRLQKALVLLAPGFCALIRLAFVRLRRPASPRPSPGYPG
jgi:hypothetical protein